MSGGDALAKLREEALLAIEGVDSMQALQLVKTQYLGPKSTLMRQLKTLGGLPNEQKVTVGQTINRIKQDLEQNLTSKGRALQDKMQLTRLGNPPDPSLASPVHLQVPLHPLTQTRDKMLSIFTQLGFSIVEGPEIDTEWFCFDALNVPKNHPARNEQDTFFLPKSACVSSTSKRTDEDYLLRAHTSTVQIRTLLEHKPPLKIVSSGRVFRRDTVDATHNFNFHQTEGLCVSSETNLLDLKGTLDFFVRAFFGKPYNMRLRPSFFPFTEPSFEMDIFVPHLGKIKDTWIEVCGCGMVHPNVFEAVGLNGQEWQGFAFGFGVERLAMLLYGIDDVRRFYQNDARFLKQF
ncbi:MAG: phenylalanine--tRNA ligase subunit alpha [Puniceicoccales bacterium]|jgi:phenylalanyl-tRNA synthetase alpha chain|nr:phenylalanine--tRNA ligase subunit alpha [Puniceicoccales bacterium]